MSRQLLPTATANFRAACDPCVDLAFKPCYASPPNVDRPRKFSRGEVTINCARAESYPRAHLTKTDKARFRTCVITTLLVHGEGPPDEVQTSQDMTRLARAARCIKRVLRRIVAALRRTAHAGDVPSFPMSSHPAARESPSLLLPAHSRKNFAISGSVSGINRSTCERGPLMRRARLLHQHQTSASLAFAGDR